MIVNIDELLKRKRVSFTSESGSLYYYRAPKVYDSLIKLDFSSKKYDELIEAVKDDIHHCGEVPRYVAHMPLIVLENKLDTTKTNEVEEYVEKYIKEVIPTLTRSNLDDVYAFDNNMILNTRLEEACKKYLIADRILNNHRNFEDSFKIMEGVNTRRNSIDLITEYLYNTISSYNAKPYQQFNMCLEEGLYTLGINNIEYSKPDFVKSMLKYFLLSEADEDITNYRRVLKSNYVFNEVETEPALKLLDIEATLNKEPSTISDFINKYTLVSNIPLSVLCSEIGTCSMNDLKLNLDSALDFIWKSIVINEERYDEAEDAIKELFASISNKLNTQDAIPTVEDIREIEAIVRNWINKDIKSVLDVEKGKLESFKSILGLQCEQFMKDCSFFSNRNNIDTITDLRKNAVRAATYESYNKMKFKTLLNHARTLSESVDKALENYTTICAKVNSNLIDESYTLASYISEDSKADVCASQYYFSADHELEVKDAINTVCKEFNNSMRDNNIKAYYIFNPSITEVHIKENMFIEIGGNHLIDVYEASDPAIDVYVKNMALCDTTISELMDNEKLSDYLLDKNANISIDEFELLVNSMQYISIPENTIKNLCDVYSNYSYRYLNEADELKSYDDIKSRVNELSESYKPIEDFVPVDIQLEAVGIINSIISEAIDKPDIKKANIKKADASKKPPKHEEHNDKEEKHDDSNDEGEEKSKGFNFNKAFNALKLALHGLRGKTKDLSQKEKEASKNLDASASHFMKAIHDGLVSDRREAIIKGSIIPSFSRCVKYAIGLVGLGGISMVLVGNILPVIILSLGGFAMSKKLTKRERMLLLDEIEIELEVVDKEIANAESKNQMKKYKKLLAYKKDLQRQYQRIKYNVKIGKDIMPNSATGVYKPGGE